LARRLPRLAFFIVWRFGFFPAKRGKNLLEPLGRLLERFSAIFLSKKAYLNITSGLCLMATSALI